MSRAQARTVRRLSPDGRFLRATGAGLGLAALTGAAWEVGEQFGPRPAAPVASGRGGRARLGARSLRPAGAGGPSPTPCAWSRSTAASSVPSADWVVEENRLPGTLDWVMSATSRIYGYSDRVSAVRGDTVTLFVDPPPVPYQRRAVPDGLLRRARRSAGVASDHGVGRAPANRPPTVAPGTNMVECQWRPTMRVRIDALVASGCVPVQADREPTTG